MKRKGYTLMEILMAIAILPFAMVAISTLFRTFIRDVPQTTRLLQQNTTVLNLFEQVRRDVAGATTLPRQYEGSLAGENLLLIEQPQAVVCYRLDRGQVVRTLLGGQPSDERVWSARDAVIEWRPWIAQDDGAYAVEVHSYLKQSVQGRLVRRFASSYVFFTRGPAEGVETR